MALIVDASVGVGWIVLSQETPLTTAALLHVRENSGFIPAHFAMEVARALRRLERRRLIVSEAVDRGLQKLRQLHLIQDDEDPLDTLPAVILHARTHSLKAADAAYLEFAMRKGYPLATRDEALATAAETAGVSLFDT